LELTKALDIKKKEEQAEAGLSISYVEKDLLSLWKVKSAKDDKDLMSYFKSKL
tara:strand:+ start:324 stop:482 length:159 start_codon:yes stop_codon:yes gene_type:complete